MNPIKLAAPTREPHYLVRIGAESRGPYDVHALETLALNQTITPTTLLALEGSTDFKPATEWPFFEQVFPAHGQTPGGRADKGDWLHEGTSGTNRGRSF